MDNLLAKIPLLGDKILSELDNQSLVKFREVKKSWHLFINEEKITWLRIIQKCIGNGGKFSTEWTHFMNKLQKIRKFHRRDSFSEQIAKNTKIFHSMD